MGLRIRISASASALRSLRLREGPPQTTGPRIHFGVTWVACLALLLLLVITPLGWQTKHIFHGTCSINIYKYTPINGSEFGEFIGAEELHFSHVHCIGAIPHNKTCIFRNLYYDGLSTNDIGVWAYFVSVDSVDVATSRLANEIINKSYVHLPPFARDVNFWRMRVVFFLRQSLGKYPCSEQPTSQHDLPLPPQLQHTKEAGGFFDSHDDSNLVQACKRATGLSEVSRLQCIAPGVSGVVHRPVFYLRRTTPFNIGHWLWDDAIPWFGAVLDLGLEGFHNSLQLLMADDPCCPSGEVPLVTATYSAIFHKYKPLLFPQFRKTHPKQIIMFRTFIAGLGSRGTHSIQDQYSVYGAPATRVIWKFRQHYLRGLQIAYTGPVNHTAAINVTILQKPDKRRLLNMTELLRGLGSQFPDCRFEVVQWHLLRSHIAEVHTLLSTQILISVDGTGANTLFLLPPGAVHISLGVATAWGSGNLGDFMFSGVDHIRVLYYDGLSPTGDMSSIAHDMLINSSQLHPFVSYAIKLVKDGFVIPVPFLTNHSPNGRMCHRLFKYYPELANVAQYIWLHRMPPCDRLRRTAHAIYVKLIGKAPATLARVVSGELGYPPGPDKNEVTGKVPV